MVYGFAGIAIMDTFTIPGASRIVHEKPTSADSKASPGVISGPANMSILSISFFSFLHCAML
jgi:hypothetical protein